MDYKTSRFIKNKFPAMSGFLVAMTIALHAGGAFAASIGFRSDFMDLSLEELMEIRVTTVSKKEERLTEAPAAVFVITQEDIRRSGATAIPEVLRMVPGVEVARIDGNKWSIAIRGFSGLFARKLLVLIDGRSVYTGLFAGTFWDTQDTVLEDIERIEVVRGPGGTLWGANAVSGVINIITKHAKDTQGGMVSAGVGNVEQGFTTFRYGANSGPDLNYRVYGKVFNRGSFDEPGDVSGNSDWHSAQGGFRVDWDASESNSLTVQGDVYGGESNSREFVPQGLGIPVVPLDNETDVRGANLLARWTHEFSQESELQAQFFYTREDREDIKFQQKIDIVDLDIQHRFQLAHNHDVVWGVNARSQFDELGRSFLLNFNPMNDTNHFVDGFVQDTMTVIPDRLRLIVGSKLGHNSYTGFEFQPNARLSWTPHRDHALWASVSRAVRTPSRVEDSAQLNFLTTPGVPNPLVFSTLPNTELKSEDLLAYEIGYRGQVHPKLLLDVATFFYVYDDLISNEPQAPQFLPTQTVFADQFQNQLFGEAYGVEVAATWQALDFWKLKAGFTWLEFDLYREPTSNDVFQVARNGESPEVQFNFRSYLDLPYDLEFDTAFNYVDDLTSPTNSVEEYYRLDLRLGWQPREALELSLVGQNLLEKEHVEFNSFVGGVVETPVPRSVYGKVTWFFK